MKVHETDIILGFFAKIEKQFGYIEMKLNIRN